MNLLFAENGENSISVQSQKKVPISNRRPLLMSKNLISAQDTKLNKYGILSKEHRRHCYMLQEFQLLYPMFPFLINGSSPLIAAECQPPAATN